MSVAALPSDTVDPSLRETHASTWVVVPTYNERDNIEPFVEDLLTAVPDARLLVVDDNSPDGTGEMADELSRRDGRVAVRHRFAKTGLGAAYRDGFRQVLKTPGVERVVQMDCDFSHDPRDVCRLLARLDDGYDVVLGSRYVAGGSTPGWGLKRRVISRAGSLVARSILGLSYRDLTGGFKAWSASTLSDLDLDAGYAQGYGFQIEMTYRAHARGARIAEVPITFRDRTAGSSKMTAGSPVKRCWRSCGYGRQRIVGLTHCALVLQLVQLADRTTLDDLAASLPEGRVLPASGWLPAHRARQVRDILR